MRGMGYGKGYQYAHDYAGNVVEQQHLPDELAGDIRPATTSVSGR